MGYVEEFFEKIDLATINRFVAENMSEDLHLEFKAPRNRDEAKRPLAKAVSAFANADGGVIIWGVERKGNACERRPIADAARFKEQLEDQTGQAVSPPAPGVRSGLIPEAADRGYVKTFVPGSDMTPHMAKFGDNRYYRRSGSNSHAMEHYELEDMFGRRPKPKLALFHELEQSGKMGDPDHPSSVEVRVDIGIENSGRGAARFASLWFEVAADSGEYELDWRAYKTQPCYFGFNQAPLAPVEQTRGWYFASDAGLVIHPGMRCKVTAFNISVPSGVVMVPDLTIDYQLSAEGMVAVQGTYSVWGGDVHSAARGPQQKKL
jgi:hypothetical protein